MADPYATTFDMAADPARKLAAVTPNDTTDLATVAKALWITTTGTLSIIAAADSVAVSLGTVQAGTLVPVRTKRVMLTGTTAGVVALY